MEREQVTVITRVDGVEVGRGVVRQRILNRQGRRAIRWASGYLYVDADNVAYYDGTRREVEEETAIEQARQEWLAETRAALDYIDGPGG